MYRLTVIAGPSNAQPARGSSFAVGAGSFSIGRHSRNQIVLHSGNVSKLHCVLVVDNTRVAVEDQGSANGTFVNGKLSAKRDIQPGDRISVGEFVLELSDGKKSLALAFQNTSAGNILPFPASHTSVSMSSSPAVEPSFEDAPMPKDLVGKVRYHFDRYVLPYFFSFNERYEWRIVIGSLFGLYLLLNLFISLSPLMSEQERAIEREISQRARLIARELADRNTPFIAAKSESKLDLGTFNKAHSVRVAVIVDMESRILAPAAKAGNYFQNPPSAAGLVAKASKAYHTSGKLTGIVTKVDDHTIVAIEPIEILNPVKGANEARAMAVVALDTSLSALEGGTLWMVYAHTLVLSILIGLFVFYLIYRITIHPIQDMNRKVDRVLRGENIEFKPTVYFSEMDPLWDLIDSTLKRVPKGDEAGSSGGEISRGISASDFIGPLRTIASASSNGVAILDEERKILFVNPIFEEITGVRFESYEGQMLTAASRDQAFSALIIDLCDRALPGTEGSTEEFDFSGLEFKIHVVSFGPFGDPKCFVFTLTRKEE